MLLIKSDRVRCPGKPGVRTFDNSCWCYVPIRQPGEYRDSRIGHSVGHENLFAHRIVGDAARIPDARGRRAIRRPAHDAQRRGVTSGRAAKDHRRVFLGTGCPDFVILEINEEPDGFFELRRGTFDFPERGHITVRRPAEHQNGIAAAVCNEDLVVNGIDEDLHGQAQLGLWSAYMANWGALFSGVRETTVIDDARNFPLAAGGWSSASGTDLVAMPRANCLCT